MLLVSASALLAGSALAQIPAPTNRAAPAPAAPPSQFESSVAAAKQAMMSDPGKALTQADRAIAGSAKLPANQAEVARATGQWLKGEALIRLNRPDEARPVLDSALESLSAHQPGSKLHADLLKAKAGLLVVLGDLQGALDSLHRAYEMFGRLGDRRSQAIVLQKIGSIYLDARDYAKALDYYDQANEIFRDDPNLKLAAHNNRGNAFKEMREYAKAEAEYRLALSSAAKMSAPLLEARILTNIASSQELAGKLAAADATAAKGLELARGDAAEWAPFLWGVRAEIARKRGDLPLARQLIERTFVGVDLAGTSMLHRDFHESAYRIYQALGQYRLAVSHLEAFKRLDDETRKLAASAQASLLSAQFDAANHALRVTRLKAADLETKVKLNETRGQLQSVTVLSAVGGTAALGIIALITLGLVTNRRNRKRLQASNELLTYTANHDGLTKIANRNHMRAMIGEAIETASAGGTTLALCLIDLDKFKQLNDTQGHAVGDAMLKSVAHRLTAKVGNHGLVGRLGGDEFAVMLYSDGFGDAEECARELIADLSRPCQIEGGSAAIGATIGIASYPADGRTMDALFKAADVALYHAKNNGRGHAKRFTAEMAAALDDRRMLEIDLSYAMAKGQFVVEYQPIVAADSLEVVAYEALLRWHHPERGEISPAVFIPIAEETRMIGQIGKWVLQQACAEAATWPDSVKLAVNLSAIQVEGHEIVAQVVQALGAHGLTPDRLEFEVTESIFLRHGESTEAVLNSLDSLGVSLALDDFGTGFSSLSYLQRTSFSKIKIDRSFVVSAAEGRVESLSIIEAISAMARRLGMETTAEGVETEEQMVLMKSLGCSQFQGYLFGRSQLAGTIGDSDKALSNAAAAAGR
jgi:diguanylate cyclase (GGDEF)-like protein